MKAAAALGREQCAAVGRADRGESIGTQDPALEEIESAIKLESRRCHPVKGQIGEGEIRGGKSALIGGVVQSEYLVFVCCVCVCVESESVT